MYKQITVIDSVAKTPYKRKLSAVSATHPLRTRRSSSMRG